MIHGIPVPPTDDVTARLDNPSEAFIDACHARDLGMTGKLCIHPRQIPRVRHVFDGGPTGKAGGTGRLPSDTTLTPERPLCANGGEVCRELSNYAMDRSGKRYLTPTTHLVKVWPHTPLPKVP